MKIESDRLRRRLRFASPILILSILFVVGESLAFEAGVVPNPVVQGEVSAPGYYPGANPAIDQEHINKDIMIDAVFAQLEATKEAASRKEAIDRAMKEAGQQLVPVETRVERGSSGGVPFFERLTNHYHPYITNTVSYDDNVENSVDYEYTIDEDQTASVINRVDSGLKMSYRGRRWSLVGDFSYTDKYLHNYTSSNFNSADAMLQATTQLGRNELTIFNDFNYYHPAKKDYSGNDDADVISIGKNYRRNNFRATLGRAFNRLGFELEYDRMDYKYEPAFEDENYHSQRITLKPYWRISAKTRISGKYAYNFKELTDVDSPDNQRYQDIGMTFFNRLTSKISDEISINQRLTNYKVSDDRKYTTFRTKLAYGVSPRTNLTLDLSHEIYREGDRQENYLEDIFSLSGNHRFVFNPKIKLGLGASAMLRDYVKRVYGTRNRERKRDNYAFNVAVDYAFRDWLDFILSYKHEINWSSLNNNSYYRNLVTFTTEARF